MTTSTSLASAFVEQSRQYLLKEYLPKIERCLERLSDEQAWWRPNEESNSIGNLLLHLSGNIRQWIVTGVGGAPDVRRRQEEFDERRHVPVQELRERLRQVLGEVDQVLRNLEPDALLEKRQIQGMDVTVLMAIYHAVEHFAMHTGQILYITKELTGSDLGFYEVKDGKVARTRWDASGS
jgi:uncharacterized damage-inducible protein DinB